MSTNSEKDEFDINQIWEALLCHPDFRKQRALFSPLIGNALWWLATVRVEKGRRKLILNPATHGLWQDSRLPTWPCKKSILKEIARFRHTAHPFDITCPEHGFHTHCIPIVSNKTDFHALAITHIDDRSGLKSILHLLYSNLKILLKCVLQEAESKRLADSLKPRMVALSTVHTVHRLINTTLSLSELYQRLSRLTAQVLRVSDCSILIRDKARNTKKLYERGRTGVPARKNYKFRTVKIGEGLEGRVFSSAKHVLRKNILCIPMIDEDVIGVMTLKGKKDSRPFDNFDREILMTLSEEAVVAIKNAELYEDQKKVTYETIQSLSKLLDTKFSKHRKISDRLMMMIADHICRQLKIGENESEAILHAVRLKNASKLGLSDEILNSSNRLTHDEQRSIHRHPVEGAEILGTFQSLKPIASIVMTSHEKFDGSGYPFGYKGKQIPIGSRILSILNAFDALISGRPYQAGMDFKEANLISDLTVFDLNPKILRGTLELSGIMSHPQLFASGVSEEPIEFYEGKFDINFSRGKTIVRLNEWAAKSIFFDSEFTLDKDYEMESGFIRGLANQDDLLKLLKRWKTPATSGAGVMKKFYIEWSKTHVSIMLDGKPFFKAGWKFSEV